MPALRLIVGDDFIILADALNLVDQVLKLVVLCFDYLVEFLDHLILPVMQLDEI